MICWHSDLKGSQLSDQNDSTVAEQGASNRTCSQHKIEMYICSSMQNPCTPATYMHMSGGKEYSTPPHHLNSRAASSISNIIWNPQRSKKPMQQ